MLSWQCQCRPGSDEKLEHALHLRLAHFRWSRQEDMVIFTVVFEVHLHQNHPGSRLMAQSLGPSSRDSDWGYVTGLCSFLVCVYIEIRFI